MGLLTRGDDRRQIKERRKGLADRRFQISPWHLEERRSFDERRFNQERRSGFDRRADAERYLRENPLRQKTQASPDKGKLEE